MRIHMCGVCRGASWFMRHADSFCVCLRVVRRVQPAAGGVRSRLLPWSDCHLWANLTWYGGRASPGAVRQHFLRPESRSSCFCWTHKTGFVVVSVLSALATVCVDILELVSLPACRTSLCSWLFQDAPETRVFDLLACAERSTADVDGVRPRRCWGWWRCSA